MSFEHELEFAEKLAEIGRRSKSNTPRLESVEKNQEALNSIATSVAVMAEQQKNISKKVYDIDNKADAIESKPAKRWDSIVDKLIWLVAGAFAAWFLPGMPGV